MEDESTQQETAGKQKKSETEEQRRKKAQLKNQGHTFAQRGVEKRG